MFFHADTSEASCWKHIFVDMLRMYVPTLVAYVYVPVRVWFVPDVLVCYACVCLFACVCVRVCVCVCVFMHLCIYTYLSICLFLCCCCLSLCLFVTGCFWYLIIGVYIYIYVHAYIPTYMHSYPQKYIRACIHTYIKTDWATPLWGLCCSPPLPGRSRMFSDLRLLAVCSPL